MVEMIKMKMTGIVEKRENSRFGFFAGTEYELDFASG